MEGLLELACLGFAALRVAGIVAMPAVRRELRAHPVFVVPLALGALFALAAVAWAADRPWALRSMTALVVAAWVLVALRARPAYGRRCAWPPGSIGLRPSLEALVDREFNRRQFARYGPIFKMAQFRRPVACLLGIDKARAFLRENEARLGPAPAAFTKLIRRGFLRYMQPDDHEYYSRLLRTAFSESVLSAVEPFAIEETRRGLALLSEESQRRPSLGASPLASIDRILLAVIQRLFFGGLFRDDECELLDAHSWDFAALDVFSRTAPRAERALRRFEQLLSERGAVYDASRDVSVWGEIVRLDPGAARNPTIAGNLLQLFQDSQDNVGGMLAWMVKMLSDAPEWIERVRVQARADRPPASEQDDPYTRATLETLRLARSEYVYREVLEPIAIDGFTIPKGWLLRICVWESHRLETIFEDPDVFDPDRHLRRRFKATELSPFGLDFHACLGARLSLLLGRILAEQLVNDFDLEVVGDGPVERDNRHWHHWEPSSSFRVVLRKRGEAKAISAGAEYAHAVS